MNRATGKRWFWGLVCVSVLLRLAMMAQSVRHVPVTTDEAVTVLQARDMARGEFKLFVYAQPYQFPVEAYLMAPIARWLPGNALGSRGMNFGLGFLILGLMLWLVHRLASPGDRMAALLLILFPSAYLVLFLRGYPIPNYMPSFVLWTLMALGITFLQNASHRRDLLVAVGLGFCCGLAFSNNMVSLTYAVPTAVVVLFRPGFHKLLSRGSTFVMGGGVGLLPYLAGILRYPAAQAPVSGTRGLREALGLIRSPTLTHTLPGALGINPTRFPDERSTVEFLMWARPFMGGLFVLVLVVASLRTVARVFREIREKEFPTLGALEVFIGAAWINLAIFLLSNRATGGTYRYLTPAAWAFPFLVLAATRGLSPRLRPVWVSSAALLAGINMASTMTIVRSWREPNFASHVVSAPDLNPALEWLEANDYKHAVASFWAAYRITFLSDGRVLASQPQNERFRHWPLPYKDEVDASNRVAYVLTDRIRFLQPAIFERHMDTMGVRAQRHQAGHFSIYHDFERLYVDEDEILAPPRVRAGASEAPDDVGNMFDGNSRTYWRSERPQSEGMHLTFEFDEPLPISRVVLKFGLWGHDSPGAFGVEVLTGEDWGNHGDPIPEDHDKFIWMNNKPVYGRSSQQTLRLNTPPVRGIRVRLLEPKGDFHWTVAEAEVYVGETVWRTP